MDILIQASQDGTLSDLDIREEVDTFMLGVFVHFLLSFTVRFECISKKQYVITGL